MYGWAPTPDVTQLGASQKDLPSTPQGKLELPEPAQGYRSVSVKPSDPAINAVKGPTLQTRQLWEGTVIEVGEGAFVATLTDRTHPDNPEEQGVFEKAEVSPDDAACVAVGSTFYWVVGTERTPAGQVRNVSQIQFRRIPAWSKGALNRVAKVAEQLASIFTPAL